MSEENGQNDADDVVKQRENNEGDGEYLLGGVTGKGFMPGKSGNPSGRPKQKTFMEVVRETLREQGLDEAAKSYIAKMIEGSFQHAKEYIDREEGKVPDVAKHDVDVRVHPNALPPLFRRRTENTEAGGD